MKLNKRKFFTRFFLPICTVVIIIFVWSSIKNNTIGTYTIEWGSIESNIVDAVIVRNETVVKGEDYGRVEYSVLEGQKVSTDQQIALVYKKEYVQSVLDDLNELENDIYKYQKDNVYKDIETPELLEVDININKSIDELLGAMKKPTDTDFAAIESKLRTFIIQRQEYLKNSQTSNQHLTKLYGDEAELINRLTAWRTSVKCKQAGFVSFNYDGLENVLNFQSLQTIDSDYISTALKNLEAKTNTKSDVGKPLYRIVNGAKWWVVANLKSDIHFEKGSNINIKFIGIAGDYKVTVNDYRKSKSGNIAVFELTGDITPFITVRNINIALNNLIEGYKVPNNAIKLNGSTKGVYINDSTKRFVPVKVIGKEKGYSIIESLDSTFKFSINQSLRKR